MELQRFEEKGLSHYSYVVGCEEKGQIAVIDPRRDVEVYLEYAEKNRYIISHVFETHIPGDYASGARELARRARASLVLSGYDKGEAYEVTFAHKECFEGDLFQIGSIQLKVLHTPGHSPEHISFLLYDLKKPSEVPVALFSGDFLLVGTVGRPFLLEDGGESKVAQTFYESIQEKLKGLPDELEIFPTHGYGAFYGFKETHRCSSRLGYEKLSNPFLKPNLSQEAFAKELFQRETPLPHYLKRMKICNSSGDRLEVPTPIPMEVMEFKKQVDLGAIVIDLRDQKAFGMGHIPHSLCIGAGEKIGFWASWVVSYDHPLILVTDDPTRLEEAVHCLARVGLDRVLGYLKGGFETWKRAGLPSSHVGQITPDQILSAMNEDPEIQLIDVRTSAEWSRGHIEGAQHIPCLELPQKIGEIPPRKLIFVCAGGYRSTLAASLAKRAGHDLVGHIPGGMHAWQGARLDIVTT